MRIVGLSRAEFDMSARSPELLKSIGDHEVGGHGAAVGDRRSGLPIGSSPDIEFAAPRAGVTSPQVEMLRRALERHDARHSGQRDKLGVAEAEQRARLVDQLGYFRAVAGYVQNSGEVLARLEEVTQSMRRNGKDPFAVPLSQIDTYDLSKIGKAGQDWDFGAHRPIARDGAK